MIFQTSIRRELTRNFNATLLILVIIMLTMMLIRSLRLANRGLVSPSEVSLVLGYTMLAYLPVLLTLSLFVSVVYCLSRMYRDSEMAVWFSSGLGLLHFLRPLARFAWPVVVLVAITALIGWPWANTQIFELRNRYQSRGDLERIAPGQFQESSDGTRVFYVSDVNQLPTPTGNKFFVFLRQPESDLVISAHNGRVENQKNGSYAVLSDGQSTEIAHDDHILSTSRFEELGIRIGERVHTAKTDAQTSLLDTPPRTINSHILLSRSEAYLQAELGWRLGMALACMNFLFIGLVFSNVNPRTGRSGNLIFALLVFVAYYNFINIGQKWVANGTLNLWNMLLILHGSVLAATLLWLYKRHQNWSLRLLLAGKRANTVHFRKN